jgi:hypothetical protein
MTDLGGEIVDSFIKGPKARRDAIRAGISASADKYLESFASKSEERKTTNYRQKILDMVDFMPKSDLANMAESLINLTSIKRRVSAESENVGGPIDVAVISKYDGFVWIKRKHYFDRELNPRYFVSQGMPITSKEGSA